MQKMITKALLVAAFLAGTPLLHAQSSNRVWFAVWNGQPNPSSDVAVQSISTDGDAATVVAGSASSFVAQTNFPALNSPYDVAVDAAMGKVYVLDNNIQSVTPEYIYSFDLTGTPAQIAASKQIIYTMPVSQADVNAGLYPLVSGIALDAVNHRLYFNQIDAVTSTNSFVGCLDLTSSSKSSIHSSGSGDPALQTLYVGQIPGQGAIAVDATNIYISAINGQNNDNGVFAAPASGSGAFAEIVTLSSGDTNFSNGFVSGVASDPQDHLIYYLTFNAGDVNQNYSLTQNAVWVYDTVAHTNAKIASGYQGYPANIAVDATNHRYYFTVGRDGTGNASATNYQAIYTGVLGSTNAPTLFYKPALSGQDVDHQANAGLVILQGIYIQDTTTNRPPVAGADTMSAEQNQLINFPIADLLTNDSDLDGNPLSITAVSGVSTNGGTVSLNGLFIAYTPATDFVGWDQFTYTLSDGSGGQAQGTVTINVLPLNLPSANQIVISPSGRFLLYDGVNGQNYVIQYADSLPGPWHDLSPVLTAGISGIVGYNDLFSPVSATRFYRVHVSP